MSLNNNNKIITWLQTNAEKPPSQGDLTHYFEKANNFFSQQKGTSTVKEFEEKFVEFETSYFEDLSKVMVMLTNMSCPQSVRMLWVLNSFTK